MVVNGGLEAVASYDTEIRAPPRVGVTLPEAFVCVLDGVLEREG